MVVARLSCATTTMQVTTVRARASSAHLCRRTEMRQCSLGRVIAAALGTLAFLRVAMQADQRK